MKWHRTIRIAGYETRYEKECREFDAEHPPEPPLADDDAAYWAARGVVVERSVEPITMTCSYGLGRVTYPVVTTQIDGETNYFYADGSVFTESGEDVTPKVTNGK